MFYIQAVTDIPWGDGAIYKDELFTFKEAEKLRLIVPQTVAAWQLKKAVYGAFRLVELSQTKTTNKSIGYERRLKGLGYHPVRLPVNIEFVYMEGYWFKPKRF